MVGGADPENPASISIEQLNKWTSNEVLEYWGTVDNTMLEDQDITIPDELKDFDELQNIDPNAISSQLQRLKKIKKTRKNIFCSACSRILVLYSDILPTKKKSFLENLLPFSWGVQKSG